MNGDRLSPKRQRFVDEYLIDLNATAAYKRAGYKASGESARRNASRLLTYADVQAAIAEARARLSAVLELTREDVVKGFHTEATYHGDDGSASARVSAWRELGKMLDFYPAERTEVRLPDFTPADVSEARRRVAALREELGDDGNLCNGQANGRHD